MTIKSLLGSLVITVALGACSKGGGATGATGGSGDVVDTFMKLDTDKAAAFNAGGTDCAAKAKSVGEWRTKHSAEYKAMQKTLNASWSGGPPKEVQDKYGDTMKANKKAVMSAMFACTNDPTFGKMMDDTKVAE